MTTEEIRAKIKEYSLVLLKKGPKYHTFDAELQQQNQAAHLNYLMELRVNGLIALTGPVMDGGDIIGMAVYNIADKQAVKALLENDPGIVAERFTYELLTWFGFPGDKLGQENRDL